MRVYCLGLEQKKRESCYLTRALYSVDPLGLEPRLFWTKTRRVASYTMGQLRLQIYTFFYCMEVKLNFF